MASFKIENELVMEKRKEKNYIIEYNENINENYVAIYFSSNGLYFPDDEETFRKVIIENNRFEWYKNKVKFAKKHIFVRDLFKQWYVEGINDDLNSIEKMLEFFKKETQGYKIVTIGSSAGGYGATLFGILLNAEYIVSFATQFNLYHQISESNFNRDPLLFKYLENEVINKYFDLSNLIKKSIVPIFYFVPYYSKRDKPQIELAQRYKNINILYFKSKVHGVPMATPSAVKIIGMNIKQLNTLYTLNKGKILNSMLFSCRTLGLFSFIKTGFIYFNRKLKKNFHRRINETLSTIKN